MARPSNAGLEACVIPYVCSTVVDDRPTPTLGHKGAGVQGKKSLYPHARSSQVAPRAHPLTLSDPVRCVCMYRVGLSPVNGRRHGLSRPLDEWVPNTDFTNLWICALSLTLFFHSTACFPIYPHQTRHTPRTLRSPNSLAQVATRERLRAAPQPVETLVRVLLILVVAPRVITRAQARRHGIQKAKTVRAHFGTEIFPDGTRPGRPQPGAGRAFRTARAHEGTFLAV